MALVQSVRFTHPKSHDATVLQFATDLGPHLLDGLRWKFFIQVQVDDPRIGPPHQFAVSKDAPCPLIGFTHVSENGVGPALRFELAWFAENRVCLEDFAVIGTTISYGFTAFVWLAAGQFSKTTML